MKALVLSGGKGTRLRPVTYSMAKQLVPVANKSVLARCMHNLRDIGVRDIGIVVGDWAEEIERAVGDGSELGVRVTYIHQQQPLGLGHCVRIAEDFLGDEEFVLYLGDNVLPDGIAQSARMFRQHRPDAQLQVTKVPDPRHYGVAEIGEDNVVRALVEKPSEPRSDLAVMGVYFFGPAIHQAVREVRPSGRGELEITDAIQHLITQGRTVVAEHYAGYWKDTGNIEELLECNRVLLERMGSDVRGEVDAASVLHDRAVVEEGAVVTGSKLIGPVVIGAGAVVRDSTVGPFTSVGADGVVTDSLVENSILLDGAELCGVPGLRDSLIGRWATVRSPTGEHRETGHHKLIIGDHASAEVAA